MATTEHRASGAATVASVALLVFSGVSTVFLVAWLATGAPLFQWKALLTALCALLGLVLSALLWRSPTRTLSGIGLLLMLLSVLRIGMPSEWNGFSFALLSLTLILAMPLANAIFSLKS
jgi:hypothetical protein